MVSTTDMEVSHANKLKQQQQQQQEPSAVRSPVVESMGIYGRGENISSDPPSSRTHSSIDSKKKATVVKQVKTKVREYKAVYYMFILAFLMLHWIDMGTDAYMISFYWEKNHMTYFSIASIFYIMANFLAIFWNFQLFDRNLCLALVATVLGPVSRHIFVEIMPSSRTRSISDGIQQPEGWRNSDEEDTEEIKNFTLIFAAMFEDLPQASVNLAFLSRGDKAPVEATIQVIASIVMGVMKISHGCNNILCNYDELERPSGALLRSSEALPAHIRPIV